MSTRSSISVKVGEQVKTIYCHFDGYPSHHMPILTGQYNSQEMAEKLIELGDLSILDSSPEKPEGHSFGRQVEGYCVAYGRDRGETNIEARTFADINSAIVHASEEYNYYFDGKSWELIE